MQSACSLQLDEPIECTMAGQRRSLRGAQRMASWRSDGCIDGCYGVNYIVSFGYILMWHQCFEVPSYGARQLSRFFYGNIASALNGAQPRA